MELQFALNSLQFERFKIEHSDSPVHTIAISLFSLSLATSVTRATTSYSTKGSRHTRQVRDWRDRGNQGWAARELHFQGKLAWSGIDRRGKVTR